LAHLLEGHLRDLAYQVDLSFDGLSGLAKADTCNYDLIILDAENPDLSKVVFFVS
jgi:DNA-binding response OmpR family regulator